MKRRKTSTSTTEKRGRRQQQREGKGEEEKEEEEKERRERNALGNRTVPDSEFRGGGCAADGENSRTHLSRDC